MESVLGLIEHDRDGGVDHFVSDLVPPVRREAVHEEGVRGGVCHQGRIYLVGDEDAPASIGFRLLAHRRPDVGVYRIRVADAFGRIIGHDYAAAEARDGSDTLTNGMRKLESGRRGDPNRGAQHRTRLGE